MQLAYRNNERHPVVDRFLERRWRDAKGGARPAPSLDISLDDEMFRYALSEQHQHRGMALMAYLRSGLTAAETLQSALRETIPREPAVGDRLRVLDFAAGYGRVTRFLHPLLCELEPHAQLEVAEISEDALEFQHHHLGFAGHPSTTDASCLSINRRYDAVTCCSLFTHLPRHRWQPWLAALWNQLDERVPAVLVFSTNGEEVLFDGRTLDADGFCFESVSEKEDLELSEYGTTWTSADFVRRQVESACSGCTSLVRVPRGLWHFQDLWIASRRDHASSSSKTIEAIDSIALPLPPEGYLDICTPQHASRLGLGGWAVDRRDPDQPPQIEVFLAGEKVAATRADRPRPEIATQLGDSFLRCGWQAEIELPGEQNGFDPAALLEVTATSEAGRTTMLHLSALEGADLVRRASGGLEETRSENLRLRVEVERLQREKAAMAASRFWKLRNAWFRLTGRR